MPVIESWVLDGVPLTNGTFTLMELTADPPRARMDWISAADSEDAALFRQPLHENRTITMKLRVTAQASMDAALDQVGALVDKLRAASSSAAGIALVWTPTDSARSRTFDVVAGEITGMPIGLQGDGVSWVQHRPIVTIELTCKPYWRGVEFTTVTDAFGSNSIADYTFDAGAAGNVSITGGVVDAAANLTTENRFLHTGSPYSVTNSQETLKHTLGTTLTSYKAGVIVKRADASNYIECYVDDTGAVSRLRIDSVVATVRTNLVSTNLAARLVVSTSYWVRGRIEGNVVVAEHWLAAPTVTGTATLSNTATLAGGTATVLGTGVSGRAGIVWTPQQTAAALDDFEIAPNVTTSGATPFAVLELAGVTGDVPALGRLIITDAATQSRRHMEWGLEGPATYNSATSLLIDSDDMVTSGFAGAQTTTAGCYDPNASGNNSVGVTLYSTPVAIAGTGNLSHIGTFRVKARMLPTNTGCYLRLAWQAGDGPVTSNPWATHVLGGEFVEIDLGLISVPAVTAGTQRWTGRVEGYTTTIGAVVKLDYLELIPVSDGYGKARATYSYSPGVIVAQDAFVGTTAAAALGTRAAPLGGSWATSGDATDFAFADNFDAVAADGIESISRATTGVETSGRFAILGSTSYTDCQVDCRIRIFTGGGASADQALIARWVDSINYLRFTIPEWASPVVRTVKIEQVVAGVATTLASSTWSRSVNTKYRARLIAFASGRIIGQVLSDAGGLIAELQAFSSVTATGGALQTGKPGARDQNVIGGTATRYFTEFAVSTPAAEPIVIYSGRNMQVRYDDVIRQDAAATYTGRPQSYRGGRFVLPVGTSRVFAKARGNDIDTGKDDTPTNAALVQVAWTPRGLAVPR